MRINYQKQLKEVRKEKFDKLDTLKPFPHWKLLPTKQKIWLIRYYKLQAIWQFLGYSQDTFPRLRDGPIIEPAPWMDPEHILNRKLEEVIEVVEKEYGHNWGHFTDYEVGYYFLDENLEIEDFGIDFKLIEIPDWEVCPECVCDKCYQYGLCGLECTNPKKQCENIREVM